jgi:hypothetical protein
VHADYLNGTNMTHSDAFLDSNSAEHGKCQLTVCTAISR